MGGRRNIHLCMGDGEGPENRLGLGKHELEGLLAGPAAVAGDRDECFAPTETSCNWPVRRSIPSVPAQKRPHGTPPHSGAPVVRENMSAGPSAAHSTHRSKAAGNTRTGTLAPRVRDRQRCTQRLGEGVASGTPLPPACQ